MYSKITNPITGRKISINGKLGKTILRNYITVLQGGAYEEVKNAVAKSVFDFLEPADKLREKKLKDAVWFVWLQKRS